MIRLLIADDERLEREALAEMVTRRFVEHEIVLEEAENGRKAADTAILWGADLILMDIEMPGMNGLDAARAVLAQRPGCRVIFVTAYSLFQYAHEAVHLGACDYLLKPVDPDELKSSGCNVVDVPDKTPWQEACQKVISENTSDQAELYQQLLDMKG